MSCKLLKIKNPRKELYSIKRLLIFQNGFEMKCLRCDYSGKFGKGYFKLNFLLGRGDCSLCKYSPRNFWMVLNLFYQFFRFQAYTHRKMICNKSDYIQHLVSHFDDKNHLVKFNIIVILITFLNHLIFWSFTLLNVPMAFLPMASKTPKAYGDSEVLWDDWWLDVRLGMAILSQHRFLNCWVSDYAR